MGISFNVKAQLTGPKTVPGDYSSISTAITALNTNGVGSGGVTFNVAAGHTEIASNLVISITTNLPTVSNKVVFQKSGAGVNPLITAAPGDSIALDGIIKFSGADYITFDGIDLLDPPSNTGAAMMEWGFAILRANSSNGSQNNVIKNCTITLQKINTLSFGIHIVNKDTAGTVITATDQAGQNSYNKLYGNTISNVYKGIVVISSPTSRDFNNEIGVNGEGANQITNWGGSNVAAEGIRCEGQWDVKINNNIVNGGAGTTNAVNGILATLLGTINTTLPNYEISNNYVSVASNTSSSATYGIRANTPAFTILLHHNIVENCIASQNSFGSFNGIIHDPASYFTNVAFIHNNIVRFNTYSGTGTSTLLSATTSGFGGIASLTMHSNQVYGNQNTGIRSAMNCLEIMTASTECYNNMVYNNSISNTSGTTGGVLYGLSVGSSSMGMKIYDNVIYNLTIGGTNTGFQELTGIRSANNASSLNQIYRNKIFNLTNNTPFGTTIGCGVTGTNRINNNFISEIKSPNSSDANAVIGLNITSSFMNSTIGVYFNSVYLNASGGSTSGSSGISVTANATSTTAALDMRNNIIINLSTPGSTSGRSVAYRRSSTNLQNYAATSDYNIFYVGTPSARQLIFFDGTNSDQTLATYKTRVAPRDSNSKSVLVNFLDPVNGDLHLTGASVGDPNLIGIPISGITTDIDVQPRSSTSPYIGADEPYSLTLNLKINLQACSPIPDTITVLLRDTINPYTVIDSARGVIDATGSVNLYFVNGVNGARYYIVVKHRNSIETWSKPGGEEFTGGLLNYDFTTAASKAFGSNQILVGSKFSIYTGDVNQDGVVDLADGSLIDNDAFNFVSGYVNTDLNCDGVVDLADATFADNNGFNFVQVLRP